MRDLKPCRWCGEADKLSVAAGVYTALWAIDPQGEVIRDEKGEPTRHDDPRYVAIHHLDDVQCDVCDASASRRVWNSTPEFMATMLANIAAADAEYDDDGVWQGRAQAVGA